MRSMTLARALMLAKGMLLMALLGGCMLTAPRPAAPRTPLPPASPSAQDSAPTAAVDRASLQALPDLIARSEPRSPAGNYSPYVVFGQTYEVLERADDYVTEGPASWYGTKFHGRATSNGEVFDMYALSAAHKSLPIPSYVRVTNLANGRATILRVNDRGPFHEDRVIDLSYAAAVKLGFDLQGTAPVRVEVVAAPTAPVGPVPGVRLASSRRASAIPARAGAALSAAESIYLQAGAFRSRDAAERVSRTLRSLLGERVEVALQQGQDEIHRVRIGPLSTMREANEVQDRLLEANHGVALIVRS